MRWSFQGGWGSVHVESCLCKLTFMLLQGHMTLLSHLYPRNDMCHNRQTIELVAHHLHPGLVFPSWLPPEFLSHWRETNGNFENQWWSFSGRSMEKNTPAKVGDTGLISALGRSHEQLSHCTRRWAPGAPITESRSPRARTLQQDKPLQWEAHTLQFRE